MSIKGLKKERKGLNHEDFNLKKLNVSNENAHLPFKLTTQYFLIEFSTHVRFPFVIWKIIMIVHWQNFHLIPQNASRQ